MKVDDANDHFLHIDIQIACRYFVPVRCQERCWAIMFSRSQSLRVILSNLLFQPPWMDGSMSPQQRACPSGWKMTLYLEWNIKYSVRMQVAWLPGKSTGRILLWTVNGSDQMQPRERSPQRQGPSESFIYLHYSPGMNDCNLTRMVGGPKSLYLMRGTYYFHNEGAA